MLVRASGTESLIRVMAEGPDKDELEQFVSQIADVVQKNWYNLLKKPVVMRFECYFSQN